MFTLSTLKTRRQALEADLEQALTSKLSEVKGHDQVLVDPDAFGVTGKDGSPLQVYSVELVPENKICCARLTLGALRTDTDDDEGEEEQHIEKKDVPSGMWMDVLTDAFERAFPASLQVPVRKTGAELIADERQRQQEKEGFSISHDQGNSRGELACAARCYANPSPIALADDGLPLIWPPGWSRSWWKPTTQVRNLVKAGALIAAEIDRLQVIEATKKEIPL